MDLFVSPTLDELTVIILRGIRQITGLEVYKGSPAERQARSWALGLADHTVAAKAIAKNVTPYEANLAGLEAWALVLELPRKAGTKASAAQSVLARGTAGTLIPAATLLQSASTVSYEVINSESIPLVAPFEVLLDITAQVAGSDGNLSQGDNLTFTAPPVGIKFTASVQEPLENGTDEETEGDWQQRLTEAWRQKVGGGRISDYKLWAAEVGWVDRAWIYKAKPYQNSVGVTAVKNGTGAALLPTTGERDELLANLNLQKPATDDVTWLVIQLKLIHSETVVILAPGLNVDWTWPAPGGLQVAGWDPATNEITSSTNLPSDFQAGGFFTCVTSDPTQLLTASGKPTRITAVTGANKFKVSPLTGTTPFDHVPQVGDEIWPSSAVLADARDKILNGFAEVCPGLQVSPMTELGPANPDGKYQPSWLADADESKISQLALSSKVPTATTTVDGAVDGVLKSVEFPFPTNTTVELLIPGQVWVRI